MRCYGKKLTRFFMLKLLYLINLRLEQGISISLDTLSI